MVIFKEILPTELYEHFLLLFCGVTICYADAYKKYLPFAQNYFDKFIEGCANIYGNHSIVSNVHNLTHVVDDVKLFGNLNTISAYPFENRLHFLKLRLKQKRLPLQQITRRIVELSLDYDQLYVNRFAQNMTFPQFSFAYMLDDVQVYKTLNMDSGCTLSSIRKADSWFLTKKFEIVQMEYATQTTIHGYPIIQKDNFFSKPVSSKFLNIFKSDGVVGPKKSFGLDEILAKMICISHDKEFVFLPLLHTLKEYL